MTRTTEAKSTELYHPSHPIGERRHCAVLAVVGGGIVAGSTAYTYTRVRRFRWERGSFAAVLPSGDIWKCQVPLWRQHTVMTVVAHVPHAPHDFAGEKEFAAYRARYSDPIFPPWNVE
jgi:hypothetical protein